MNMKNEMKMTMMLKMRMKMEMKMLVVARNCASWLARARTSMRVQALPARAQRQT